MSDLKEDWPKQCCISHAAIMAEGSMDALVYDGLLNNAGDVDVEYDRRGRRSKL